MIISFAVDVLLAMGCRVQFVLAATMDSAPTALNSMRLTVTSVAVVTGPTWVIACLATTM